VSQLISAPFEKLEGVGTGGGGITPPPPGPLSLQPVIEKNIITVKRICFMLSD
jgi:hypothetical protein